jgi:outer membrane protein assembly factor BamB
LTERWAISPNASSATELIVTNGSVFVPGAAGSQLLESYNLLTGKHEWTRRGLPHPRDLTLLSGGDFLFISQASGEDGIVSRAVATSDGSPRWSTDMHATPVDAALAAGHLCLPKGSDVLGFDAATGEECWQQTFDGLPRIRAATVGELVVTNATGTDGELTVLDAETGQVTRSATVSSHFHPDDDITDGLRDRMIVGDDRWFVHTFGGRLLALHADTGAIDWVEKSSQPNLLKEGGNVYAPSQLRPVAISGETLLVFEEFVTDEPDVVYALDATTGETKWTVEAEAKSLQTPAVAGNTVFVLMGGKLQLFDLAEGDHIDAYDVAGWPSSVVLAGGLCVVSTTEELIAFESA